MKDINAQALSVESIVFSDQACPHDVPWTLSCWDCEQQGLEVPKSVLDAASQRDRLERKGQARTS